MNKVKQTDWEQYDWDPITETACFSIDDPEEDDGGDDKYIVLYARPAPMQWPAYEEHRQSYFDSLVFWIRAEQQP
jgi:hypothetical protein